MNDKAKQVVDRAFGKIAQKAIAGKKATTRNAAYLMLLVREIRDTAKALDDALAAMAAAEHVDHEETG